MPEMMRKQIRNVLNGREGAAALAAVSVVALAAFDAAVLGLAVPGSSGGWLAGFVLLAMNAVLLAGALRALSSARPEDEGRPRGGRRLRPGDPIPIRAEARMVRRDRPRR